MKKKFLALLLAIVSVFCLIFAGCGDKPENNGAPQKVDYAAQAKLDLNGGETLKQEVTVLNYIDGDTTHFNIPKNVMGKSVLKARYLAVNTPESTGKIEEWGKKASKFTKEKLKSADSIILETNGSTWEVDSTGDRHLVWVWYKNASMTDYRCLNIEILQEGLAFGSSVDNSRYGSLCRNAIDQAIALELYVFSDEKDPDYFYGEAYEIDLKELRLNIKNYVNTKVAFNGYVTKYNDRSVFVQHFDEETQTYYGITVYYGFFLDVFGQQQLEVGNYVRIVGNVQYYEVGDTYQISDLNYSFMDTENPDNIKRLDDVKYDPVFTEITAADWFSNRTVTITVIDEETNEETETTQSVRFTELALSTAVSMKNLKVVDVYTTSNEDSKNKGAMTLTCQVDGKEISVRTVVLKDADGNLITEEYFLGKTINVKGIIDYYKTSYGDPYQIKLFTLKDVTFVE